MQTTKSPKTTRIIVDDDCMADNIPAVSTPTSIKPTIQDKDPHSIANMRARLDAGTSSEVKQTLAQDIFISEGNTTLDELQKRVDFIPYSGSTPMYSKETCTVDIAMKAIVADIEAIGDKLNIKVEKSIALGNSWKTLKDDLDTYIKSHQNITRFLKWGACLTTMGVFLFKMGLARKVPEFLLSTLANIPAPSMQSVGSQMHSFASQAKPTDTTLHAFLETPLTPIMVLTGAGGLAITVSLLKVTLWLLRRKL